MTRLFYKITNQMLTCCIKNITKPGAVLWLQDKTVLIANLRSTVALYKSYRDQYGADRESLAKQSPRSKQFDFDPERIFGKFVLFVKRCTKLIDMFSTLLQFETLAKHTHIDGMGELIANFFSIIDPFKRKSYDLLDFRNNQYDRDLLGFNTHIHDLDIALQGFISNSFETISNTETALRLLAQFEAVLHRDALKQDLDDKATIIFQNYGLELEAVQKLYEKQKHIPPLSRNAPPVAGAILWSRQLLRRIEEPMHHYAKNEAIMKNRESKRIIRTYNQVAAALVVGQRHEQDSCDARARKAESVSQCDLFMMPLIKSMRFYPVFLEKVNVFKCVVCTCVTRVSTSWRTRRCGTRRGYRV